MIKELFSIMFYGFTFLSLFFVDYLLGNGFVDMFQKLFCKIICFVRKTVRAEEKLQITSADSPVNISVLVSEFLFLALTIAFLNKYKQKHSHDVIDDLLMESKDVLQQTNEYLEKWRLRKINWQVHNEYSYLDEEPQKIIPFKLEVPILHMAIIDTLGTSRNQLERGDAGDTINIADSTLLSMTSLLDDNLDSIAETTQDIDDKSYDRNHQLWNVMEEDSNFQE